MLNINRIVLSDGFDERMDISEEEEENSSRGSRWQWVVFWTSPLIDTRRHVVGVVLIPFFLLQESGRHEWDWAW